VRRRVGAEHHDAGLRQLPAGDPVAPPDPVRLRAERLGREHPRAERDAEREALGQQGPDPVGLAALRQAADEVQGAVLDPGVEEPADEGVQAADVVDQDRRAAAPHQRQVERARREVVEQDVVAAVAYCVPGGGAGDQPLARVVAVQPLGGELRQPEVLALEPERAVVVVVPLGAHRGGTPSSGRSGRP
jgi:hypothetical protein